MNRRIFVSAAVATVLAGASATPTAAWAQGVPDAANFINSLSDRAFGALRGAGGDRSQQFRQIFTDGFAVPQIAQFILGRYWRVATDAEKQEYTRLFTDYIVQIYSNRLTDYKDGTLKVTQSRAAPDDQAVVRSEFTQPGKQPIKIDWQVRRTNPSYKVLDVIIEDVSMSITQRDEFAAVIQRGGGKVEALLAMLRDKTKSAGR